MDMTCRCKKDYTCVACKVKRGDYTDWMDREVDKPCPDCGVPVSYRSTFCRKCWNARYYSGTLRTA